VRRSHSIALLAIGFIGLLALGSCQQDDRPFVVSKIQRASKLATCETTVDKIILATEQKRIIKWLGGRKQAMFLAYSKATIKTGVDLDKLSRDDIKIVEKSITIDLPAVEVINFSYPSDEFKIDTLLTQRTLFDNITLEEREELYRMAEVDIRNNLQYLGIREATESKTRRMMEGLLKNLGYQEIYIHFKPGELITTIDLTGKAQDSGQDNKGKSAPAKPVEE